MTPTARGFRPYALAVVATVVSVAVTRFTWPLFAGTPFIPLFGAVVATTQWGTGPAGLVAILLAVLGAPLAFPAGGPPFWDLHTLTVFAVVAVVANRIVAGRKQAAAALRSSEAQLQATWEHAALGAALLDRLGYVQRMNPALERLLACSGTACTGMPFSVFSHPDEVAAEQQRFSELIGSADGFYRLKQRYRRQDGTVLWGRVTVSVIRGPDAVPTGALAVLEDVTAQHQAELDLRASEQKLRQAQKMEAIGQLVAGVAHNFNNLLTVTKGYTELLLERHRDQEQDRKDLEEINKATERGAALTHQLLAFGRKYEAAQVRIDLNRTVADLREMLTRVIREDIQLTIDVASVPLAIMIDSHDVEQVILNLVINARDALPMGGTIHVDVARERIDASHSPEPSVAPGEYVRLRVRDNGIGMTPDVQAHLFEPFFTTKEVGQGTGLGLAFVHGIARHGRGFVTVETAPAKGTTVSVYFPPAPDAVVDPTTAPPLSSTDHVPPGATILLVEDEGAVRKMIAQMLVRAGYRVLSAATPGEACTLFEHHPEIELLLTDIVMPEMHGPALAQRLVGQRPDLRVLFVSGYSDAIPDGATATGKAAFLAKPFPSARLVTTVAGLLTARAS
jgi:two-component system, cell cycle sensor histidine kinase and response regulator CckA